MQWNLVGARYRPVAVVRPCVLANELSAHPFQLFSARIPNLQLSPIHTAHDFRWNTQSRLHVAGQGAELCGAVGPRSAARLIGSHPVLGLPDRETPGDHDLETVLLRRLRLQRDERARVARAYDPGGH